MKLINFLRIRGGYGLIIKEVSPKKIRTVYRGLNHKPQITNYKLQITNYKLRATNYEKRATNKKSSWSHQESNLDLRFRKPT